MPHPFPVRTSEIGVFAAQTEGINAAKFPKRQALSINQFCFAVGIGRSLAYKMIKDGRLLCQKIGNRSVVPVTEVERILGSH